MQGGEFSPPSWCHSRTEHTERMGTGTNVEGRTELQFPGTGIEIIQSSQKFWAHVIDCRTEHTAVPGR